MNQCDRCGLPFFDDHRTTAPPQLCSCSPEDKANSFYTENATPAGLSVMVLNHKILELQKLIPTFQAALAEKNEKIAEMKVALSHAQVELLSLRQASWPPLPTEQKDVGEEMDDSVSPCPGCNCLTHTIGGQCGKCGAPKTTAPADGGEYEYGKDIQADWDRLDKMGGPIGSAVPSEYAEDKAIPSCGFYDGKLMVAASDYRTLQAELAKYKSENDKLKMGAGYNCSSCTTKKELAEKEKEITKLKETEEGYANLLDDAVEITDELEKRIEELEQAVDKKVQGIVTGIHENLPDRILVKLNNELQTVADETRAKLKSTEAKVSELQAEIDTLRIEKANR